MKFKIGTRGSKLALWQANFIKKLIEDDFPEIDVVLVIIKTEGDKKLDIPLSEIGGKGLFIKELEEALLRMEVDLAVHSLKDMTTQIPERLKLAAVTEREDPRDCLITCSGMKLEELRKGAVIGTSSLRRRAQVLNLRPDLVIKLLRGNLDTRLKKLQKGEYEGIIAAVAGVKRLNLEDKISQYFPTESFIPAVGQGALGIETRADDKKTIGIVEKFDDEITNTCIIAERSFLKKLEGSCKAPIAAHAVIKGAEIEIRGLVASLDGKTLIQESITGKKNDADEIGFHLGELLIEKGAGLILEKILGE